MDYEEIAKAFYEEGTLEEGSVAEEGKRTLTKRINIFLINKRALLKSYVIRLTGHKDINYEVPKIIIKP